MKTRVLILDQQSYWGGAQRVLQKLLDSFRGQIDPVVALPGPGPFADDLRSQEIETQIYPLGCYRSGRKSAREMVEFGARSAWCIVLLAREIFRQRIDLVFINGTRCLPAGVIAARLTGRPSLFSLHNTLSRRSEVLLTSWGAGRASSVVACSQAAASPMLKANPGLASKLRVLYPPVDRTVFTPGLALHFRRQPSPFVIGMVGRITPAKGHHILLQAVARLKPCDEIKIVFVGAPAPESLQDLEYSVFLRKWGAEQGLDIHWAGQQNDPDPYYRRMDVLVAPSVGEACTPGCARIGYSSSEGMPLVILEAFQRGLPVVASRTGGIPEIVKDGFNGILVQPGNSQELALALDRLRFHEGFRRKLAEQACTTIDQRFSRELYCSAVGALISELCGSPAAAPAPPLLDLTETRS